MFKASTPTTTSNSSKDSVKRFTLPVFNKPSRKNSNLAANLATAGLFSAIAACGGSSSSGSSTGNDNDNVVKTTTIGFSAFTKAEAYIDGIRYVASNTASSTFYIREGLTGDALLGTLSVTVDGEEAITYSIDGVASYFSFDQSSGELRLKKNTPLEFDTSNSSAITKKEIVITVKVKSGEAKEDKHNVTIQLGEDYRAANTGGTFYASEGDDRLIGGLGNDVFFAGQGNDKLTGGGGDDHLDGGAGDDSLIGSHGGVDQFWFGKHATSAADTNHDTITDFTRGTDRIVIKSGAIPTSCSDQSFIEATELTITKDGPDDTKITVSAWGDNDSLTIKGLQQSRGEWTKDIWLYQKATVTDEDGEALGINVGNQQDWLEGNVGNDSLIGHAGNDIIYGEGGNDRIQGNSGNDILYGGTGTDTIRGGDGDDIIYGGSGKDQFRFYGSSDTGNDIIKDFSRTDGDTGDTGDKIVLEFTNITFETMTKSYNAGNAIITGYSAEGGTITLAATNEITWHATDKPLMSSDFEIYTKFKPGNPLYSDDIVPLDDIA